MKLSKILTPVIALPMVLGTGLSTMVSCKNQDDNTANFETDSWAEVGNLANQGLDALKEHYQLDTFIGLEREVTVFDIVHKVRVIGENEDVIVDQEGEPTGKMAALTFQFSTILTQKNYDDELEAITMPFLNDRSEDHTVNRWLDSDVRDYLNNEDDEDSFKKQLEGSIGSNLLKQVGKYTFADLTNPDSKEGGGAVIHNECIFILSLGDIYDGERDQMPDEYTNDSFYPEESNVVIGGYAPYSFFSKNIKYGWKWYRAIDCLSLSGANRLNYNYWLRTGCTTPTTNLELLNPYYGQWVMGASGACKFVWDDTDCPYPIFSNEDDVGLAPCFCI